jgi:hypothetical protein
MRKLSATIAVLLGDVGMSWKRKKGMNHIGMIIKNRKANHLQID